MQARIGIAKPKASRVSRALIGLCLGAFASIDVLGTKGGDVTEIIDRLARFGYVSLASKIAVIEASVECAIRSRRVERQVGGERTQGGDGAEFTASGRIAISSSKALCIASAQGARVGRTDLVFRMRGRLGVCSVR